MKWLITISVLSIAVLGIFSAGMAEEPASKNPQPFLMDIDLEYMDSLLGHEDIAIFYVRSKQFFEMGHIPGAVNVPYKWESGGTIQSRSGSFDTSRLPKDKNSIIIFYGEGPSRLKSFKALRASIDAIEMGYVNVMYFCGGYTVWKEAHSGDLQMASKK